MSGFHHDELADVNLITDNLRDRYKDQFSILKELVQNADDAHAKTLRFGLVNGDSEHAHPLLCGPGLVVVNDGPFSESDSRAICSFGLNSKAGDPGTIGKYGLGMKSVFHLGEAFFFIAESPERTYKELLTPWGSIRADWDMTEEQWSSELRALRRTWLRAVRWPTDTAAFILYVPLRRKSHLQLPDGRTAGAIIENYPGDDHTVLTLLNDESTSVRITALLPLLRDLLSIQLYIPADDGNARCVHSSEMDSEFARPLREHRPGDSELRAAIRTGGRQVLSAGWQRFCFTEILTRLRASAAWPTSWVREGLQERQVPDKAQPHAAAVFMRDIVPGKLTIRWAVYLPVDEHGESVAIDPRMGGYSLTLHGHFFADAGRNGLYGLDDSGEVSTLPNDEARIRREWNTALAEEATLDLLLPALTSFCATLKMAEERVAALSGAIRRSKTWDKWKASISANHKWLRLVTSEGLRWALTSDERTLPLPASPERDPGRPWRVFPGLSALGNHVVFFDPLADNLVARDSDLGSLDEDEVVKLIAGVDAARTFDSSVDADYAADFLKALKVLRSDAVQRELIALLRRAVQAMGLERLLGIATPVSSIAELIGRERKLRISMRNANVAELLIRQETEALAWPSELDGGDASFESGINTLEALLTALSSHIGDVDACRLYAQELLDRGAVETRRELLKRVGHLPILSAFDCRAEQRTSVSAQFMAECWGRRTLFRAAQGTTERDRADLGPLLQAVLPKETILVVNKELAALVLGSEEAERIPPCNPKGVLYCLGYCTRELGAMATRRELLRWLKLPDHDVQTVHGMRFLLHGEPENFDRDDRLWTGRGKASAAWRKLWEAVNAPELRWTAVDPTLANLVTPADQDALNLHAIEPEHVVKFVAERGAPPVLRLDGDEFDTILGYAHWEEGSWKSLPAHLSLKGERVPIGETTYLAGGSVQLPPELSSDATAIQKSTRAEVRELQLKWIPPLDRRAAIALALRTKQPEAWDKQILDWLGPGEKEAGYVGQPAGLMDTPWLRLRSGGAVSPNKLIVLRDVEGEITELAELSKCYATPSMLAEELGGSQALDVLCDRPHSFSALHSMLRGEARSDLGAIELKAESVRSSAETMQSCPDESNRGWRLVARLCTAYGDQDGQRAFNSMTRALPPERLRAILVWLAERPGSEDLFVAYLTTFAKTAQGPGVLRGIKLQTAAATWKTAQKICIDVPGAEKGSLLSKEHREALGELVRSAPARRTVHVAQDAPAPPVEKIIEYFSPWLGRSSGIRAQVGVVVTLLAGTTRLTEVAAEMFAPHTREWVLNQIPWSNQWTGQPLDQMTLDKAISSCTVHFRAEKITEITCLSITGDPLSVPAETTPATLLAGNPELRWARIDEKKVSYDIKFRKLDIAPLRNAQLSAALQATAEGLIQFVYLRGRQDLTPLWRKLDRTEQLHLETAEKLILEYLPFYLGQIRPNGVPALVAQLRRIEELRRLRIEYSDDPSKASEYKAQHVALGKMLKENAEVQRAVLDGVRARLRDLEYQESSIAFELFQNADDACVQARQMRRAHERNRFVILVEDGALCFLHWGRPINDVGPAGFDGRERGYHRDLERMLTLAGSDKQEPVEAGHVVTGKFGLGFKSVLLACDRPEVASAGLEFEIRAGVLPHVLEPDRAAHLRTLLQQWPMPEPVPGTILRLPGAQDSAAILDDFRRNAGCLCAFSSCIREIVIEAADRRQQTVWDGRQVAGKASIECGWLQFGDEALNVLRIQMDDSVALFGLGSDGLVDLPKDTPAIWVTCPTREDQHLGFAVCGRFNVDPGRARLSRNAENGELAVRIGVQLGQQLRGLRLAPWETVRRDLGLGQAATEYDFWASVWRLFQRTVAQPDSAVAAILKPILIGAMKPLASELAVVPNGLPSTARALTTGTKLSHKLVGAFSVERAVEPLFGWAEWKNRHYDPDAVISAAASEGLTKLGFDRLVSIGMASIASWLDGKTASPEDAEALGGVLRALPKRDDRSQEVADDLRRTEQTLGNVQFRSAGRTSERARDLVAAGGEDEEIRREAFAPDNRRLSPEYGEGAREFFRFCRGRMAINANELAQWARHAAGRDARRAALTYLVRGDLGLQVQRQLTALGRDGTWLADLTEDELPEELRSDLLTPAVQVPRTPSPVVVRLADPRPALERIERWWQRTAPTHLAEYNQRVYPHGQVPHLKAPWAEDFSRSDRSEWLTLFARAAFYRAGRATDAQHRRFIEMSQQHGFWAVYSVEDPTDRAAEWMEVLERFCDDQVDDDTWEHWMRFFPHLYKLSRRLNEYAELFLNLAAETGDYELSEVLTPRADRNQQGGGINVPPPSLGIGACFVIRELLRLGYLESSSAHRHAFVPTGGVRALLIRMGLQIEDIPDVAVSSQIHEEITQYLSADRAAFGLAFDIPLQIIAANPDLEDRLVWQRASATGA